MGIGFKKWYRSVSITMIVSAWWLQTSSKFSGKKPKKQPEKLGNGQLLSGCGFVQNIAPSSLSRDRKIKMEQTNNISYRIWKYSENRNFQQLWLIVRLDYYLRAIFERDSIAATIVVKSIVSPVLISLIEVRLSSVDKLSSVLSALSRISIIFNCLLGQTKSLSVLHYMVWLLVSKTLDKTSFVEAT